MFVQELLAAVALLTDTVFLAHLSLQSNCCADLQVQVGSRWRMVLYRRGFAGALSRVADFVLGMLAVVTRQRDRRGVRRRAHANWVCVSGAHHVHRMNAERRAVP